MTNLKTNLAGIKMKNPTVLASGVLGVGADILTRVGKSGAGAVTMKSIGPVPKSGHNNPTMIVNDDYMLNAVGLPTAGFKEIAYEWKELKELTVPLIASCYAYKLEEFEEICKNIAEKEPDALELDLSCPNIKEGGMEFSFNPEVAARITKLAKDHLGEIPVFPKLSPNTPRIVEIAEACEKAGADGITAINTAGPGMAIDINTRKPILDYKTGGLSGPALKPIAVSCVYRIFEKVDIPIIGTGGVTTGKDAIEMIQAGATAVGIGTACYYRGIDVFEKVCKETQEWMKEMKVKKVKDLIGAAHG